MNLEELKNILDKLNFDYKICTDNDVICYGGNYNKALCENTKLNIYSYQKCHYKDVVKEINLLNNKYYVHILFDITEHVKYILDLKKDALTGLNNRREMDKYTSNIDEKCIIALLDIDDFKRVNDTYGHQFGDEVLKNLGEMIRKSIRKDDFAARYGGEEILIIFNSKNSESVKKRIDEINRKFNEKFKDKNITFSAGLALYDGKEKIENSIKNADIALYYIKNHGKNDSMIYVPNLNKNE